jgi:hypothetical protein
MVAGALLLMQSSILCPGPKMFFFKLLQGIYIMNGRYYTSVNVDTEVEVDINEMLDEMSDTELAELREEINERLKEAESDTIRIDLSEDGIDFDIKIKTVNDAAKLEILGRMYNKYSANALYTMLNLSQVTVNG